MKTSLTTFLHQQCFKTTTTCLLILFAVASGHAEQAQQPKKASFPGRSWVASDHPDQALQPVIKDPSVFPVLDIADRAPTPPMGFSFWNAFASDGSCDLYVRQTAEALVAKGLKDCGYDMLLAFDGSWYSTDVAQFDQGRWLVFQVKGDVQFRLTKTKGTNVVLGGV